ncbi:MAG TPA: hypothetical protein VNE42_07145 [Acidimicrobiales bacterium]|nr:hypothetical protein [Acidimicrobiales bacterium]
MTQPKFAPISIEDEVRPAYKLDVPRPWQKHRPGEFDPGSRDFEAGSGPDQGYLSLLARRFVSQIVLGDGEHVEDAIAGAIAIGMARASRFGRAPVAKDLEFALSALGFLSAQTSDRVMRRASLIGGVAHDLWHRRELVARFSTEMLSMTPDRAGDALCSQEANA